MPSSNILQLMVFTFNDNFKDISNKICYLINSKINLKGIKLKSYEQWFQKKIYCALMTHVLKQGFISLKKID